MRAKSRFLVFITLLATSLVQADDAGPARSALEAFTTGLDTFQAGFTQTVKSQDGRVQDQASGRLWLKSPDRLRWVYQGDFPETIVADGANIWIYDEALQQVTVKPQSDQASDSPLLVLSDISGLDDQFRVAELGDYENMSLLELKSLDAEAEFERILLGFNDAGVAMMAMEDAFGQRTEIHFEDMRRNQPVDPALFTFEPPADADVVGAPASGD
ncbi:MAG: outer membrane lipoprotein chaperone LolA [Xanthomonadales bacterium]|nr:outer membrane lipoprotein chaperone LolA [Xanthomonadales bacterium]